MQSATGPAQMRAALFSELGNVGGEAGWGKKVSLVRTWRFVVPVMSE